MKGYIYIIIITTLTWFGCGQEKKYSYKTSDFKPELKKHLDKLAAKGHLSYSRDTLAANFFRDSCTKDELIKILSCENPLLRVVAYKALVNRKEQDYFPLLLNQLDDTSKVMWWFYDDACGDFSVSDLMIRSAEHILSQEQKNILIDSVLNNHINLGVAQWMMKEIKPQDKYYSIIKNQCQIKSEDCHHLSLTYALAKFKRQKDIPIIKNNFAKYTDNSYCNTYIFQSIIAFPDTAFFPLLTKYLEAEIKKNKQDSYNDLKYYCLAVAQFNNKNSLDILTALTKKETYPDSWYLPHNKEYVFTAIHKYSSPIYDNLNNELRPQMDSIVMKYLDSPDYDEMTTW